MSKPSRRPGREEIKEPARKKRQKKDAPRLDLQPPHETLKSPRPLQSGCALPLGHRNRILGGKTSGVLLRTRLFQKLECHEGLPLPHAPGASF